MIEKAKPNETRKMSAPVGAVQEEVKQASDAPAEPTKVKVWTSKIKGYFKEKFSKNNAAPAKEADSQPNPPS